MNILYIGIFDDHPVDGDIVFEKGFKLNGCSVERFKYREIAAQKGLEIMNKEIIERSENKDLVFIGKGELVYSSTLKYLRGKGIIISLWYGDIRATPEQWLIDLLPNVDVYFMSSGGEVLKHYYQIGRPKVAAYYFNPSDPEIVASNNMVQRKNKIVFAGTKYSFAGAYRKEIIRYLETRKDIELYGKNDIVNIKGFIKNKIIYGQKWNYRARGAQYIDILKGYAMGIGINAYNDVPMYVSDRLTHFMEFGTCMVQSYFIGIEKLFDIDKELFTYHNKAELELKLALLKEEGLINEVAKKGQDKILKQYNTCNITCMMLDIIKNNKSDRFEWIETIS